MGVRCFAAFRKASRVGTETHQVTMYSVNVSMYQCSPPVALHIIPHPHHEHRNTSPRDIIATRIHRSRSAHFRRPPPGHLPLRPAPPLAGPIIILHSQSFPHTPLGLGGHHVPHPSIYLPKKAEADVGSLRRSLPTSGPITTRQLGRAPVGRRAGHLMGWRRGGQGAKDALWR